MNFAQYIPVFLIIASLGLVLSLAAEQSQIVAKVRGARRGKIASGYNTAMKIMIFNRLGTIIYMFLIAFSIDIGISNYSVLAVSIAACVIIMFYNIFLLAQRNRILLVTDAALIELPLRRTIFDEDFGYAVGSYLATLMNVLGLTLPLLLSNSIPEYRLTMANTGFLFNTFFTLINVLLLESKMAKILDENNESDAYIFATKVFISRTAAIITAILILTSLWIALGSAG